MLLNTSFELPSERTKLTQQRIPEYFMFVSVLMATLQSQSLCALEEKFAAKTVILRHHFERVVYCRDETRVVSALAAASLPQASRALVQTFVQDHLHNIDEQFDFASYHPARKSAAPSHTGSYQIRIRIRCALVPRSTARLDSM